MDTDRELARHPIRRRTLAIALSLPVVVIGGGLAVHGAHNLCEGRGLSAGSGWTADTSWMPPGVRCTYEHADGVVRSDLIPWQR
jgi:hypothetical protein